MKDTCQPSKPKCLGTTLKGPAIEFRYGNFFKRDALKTADVHGRHAIALRIRALAVGVNAALY